MRETRAVADDRLRRFFGEELSAAEAPPRELSPTNNA
jgi:hypothetical protein